tara:strand:- start:152 stop:328 length:177 start_codon:yes stop_codon:yes gene_type:complete
MVNFGKDIPRYEKEFCIWFLYSISVYRGSGKSNRTLKGGLKEAITVPIHDEPTMGLSQ